MISWLKENNVAVITGGANGIGRSAVAAFLARGMHVVAIDRDDQALGDLKAAAVDASKLMVITCDVSDYAAMTDVRDQVLARFGRVDCLMNNAGAMVTRGLPWEDLEGWKAQVDINLWGSFTAVMLFCPAWSSKTRQAPSLTQDQSKESPTLLAATLTTCPRRASWPTPKALLTRYGKPRGARSMHTCWCQALPIPA